MSPPCLAAGGVPYSGSAGSNLYPYLWIAGCPPLPLERRNQPLRRADQTAHPRVALRPRGNQPSIVLALIERAPHGNTGINRMGTHSSLNSQTRQRRRKTAEGITRGRRSPSPETAPETGSQPGRQPARPAGAGIIPTRLSKNSAARFPPKRGSTTYTRYIGIPLTLPCPAAPAGINRKRRALPQELEPPPSQEGISRGHSSQDRRP